MKRRRILYIDGTPCGPVPEDLSELDNDTDLPDGVDLYDVVHEPRPPSGIGDAIVPFVEHDHENKVQRHGVQVYPDEARAERRMVLVALLDQENRLRSLEMPKRPPLTLDEFLSLYRGR